MIIAKNFQEISKNDEQEGLILVPALMPNIFIQKSYVFNVLL